MQYSVFFIQTNLGKITSWAQDTNSWYRDVSLLIPRRCNFLSRRDWDETLVRLKTEMSRPRPCPCSAVTSYAVFTQLYRWRHYVFGCLSVAFVWLSIHSFRQILLPQYLMNGLGKVDLQGNSLAPTDDLIRFWKWKVKGQGHSRTWHGHPRRQGASKYIFYLVNANDITVNTAYNSGNDSNSIHC